MKRLLAILIISYMGAVEANSVGKLYLNVFMGHVHKTPTVYSTSLTTIQCSQAVMVYQKKGVPIGWIYGKVGNTYGYIQSANLSAQLPQCFQLKYPKFYNSLNLDLVEMHIWGKLYDNFIPAKSSLK